MAERNIFDALTDENENFDFDDGQSDISVGDLDLDPDDTDYSVTVNDNSSTEESSGEDETTESRNNNPRSRPRSRADPSTSPGAGDAGNSGWSFDCSNAGSNVREFFEPTGPTFEIGLDPEPIEFFLQLIPDTFFETLCEQTNIYAIQREKDPTWTEEKSKWKPTSVPELKAYVAILMFMGVCELPNYRLYWSEDMCFNQQFVSQIMTRNRYEELSRYIHIADRTLNPPRNEDGHDVLHKVRPIINLVNKTWPKSMHLSKNIAIDEAMVKYKGRCHFLQYLPAKPVKWGLKVWALCDSSNYYMASMNVYTGKRNDLEGVPLDITLTGLGEKVVCTLVKPYLQKFHVVYMDNYFTSLPLFEYLYSENTYACGTIQSTRKGLPITLKNKKVVKKPRDIVKMMKDDTQVVAWFDKRKVMVATTAHGSDDGTVLRRRSGAEYARPIAIEQYSKYYSGVDKADQLRSYYGISVKCVKWWKYLFFFCLDVSVVNAYILYLAYRSSVPGPHKKPMTHLEFNISVMKRLANNFSSRKRLGRPLKRQPIHQISKITTKRGQRDCAQCKRANRKTKTGKPIQTTQQCISCNVGLCKGCFAAFHGQNQ